MFHSLPTAKLPPTQCPIQCHPPVVVSLPQVARESELDTSLLEALSRVIQSTTDRGLDNTDYSAVFEGVYEPRVGAEARQGSCKSA